MSNTVAEETTTTSPLPTLSQLRHQTIWSIDSDEALLDNLHQFANNFIHRLNGVQQSLDDLDNHVSRTHIKMQNVWNEFDQLRVTQFVERRVWDDDPSLHTTTTTSETEKPSTDVDAEESSEEKKKKKEQVRQNFLRALQYGVHTLETSSVIASLEADEEDDEPRGYAARASFTEHRTAESALIHQLFKPKKLPFLIGSQEFLQDDLAGLQLLDDVGVLDQDDEEQPDDVDSQQENPEDSNQKPEAEGEQTTSQDEPGVQSMQEDLPEPPPPPPSNFFTEEKKDPVKDVFSDADAGLFSTDFNPDGDDPDIFDIGDLENLVQKPKTEIVEEKKSATISTFEEDSFDIKKEETQPKKKSGGFSFFDEEDDLDDLLNVSLPTKKAEKKSEEPPPPPSPPSLPIETPKEEENLETKKEEPKPEPKKSKGFLDDDDDDMFGSVEDSLFGAPKSSGLFGDFEEKKPKTQEKKSTVESSPFDFDVDDFDIGVFDVPSKKDELKKVEEDKSADIFSNFDKKEESSSENKDTKKIDESRKDPLSDIIGDEDDDDLFGSSKKETKTEPKKEQVSEEKQAPKKDETTTKKAPVQIEKDPLSDLMGDDDDIFAPKSSTTNSADDIFAPKPSSKKPVDDTITSKPSTKKPATKKDDSVSDLLGGGDDSFKKKSTTQTRKRVMNDSMEANIMKGLLGGPPPKPKPAPTQTSTKKTFDGGVSTRDAIEHINLNKPRRAQRRQRPKIRPIVSDIPKHNEFEKVITAEPAPKRGSSKPSSSSKRASTKSNDFSLPPTRKPKARTRVDDDIFGSPPPTKVVRKKAETTQKRQAAMQLGDDVFGPVTTKSNSRKSTSDPFGDLTSKPKSKKPVGGFDPFGDVGKKKRTKKSDTMDDIFGSKAPPKKISGTKSGTKSGKDDLDDIFGAPVQKKKRVAKKDPLFDF